MQGWSTLLLVATQVCPIQAAVALLIMMVVLVLIMVRWARQFHRRTLILLRNVAFHMIQNRPPADDTTRLQENLNWWETEVLGTLPRAGAKSREIALFARFGAPGSINHRAMISEKIARLDAIMARLEGEA